MEVRDDYRCSDRRCTCAIRIAHNTKKIMQDPRYVLGIILGILSCDITLRISCAYRTPAVSMYAFLHSRAYIFISMLLCMLPAAFEFYEDIKDGNIRNVLSRMQLEEYVRVKAWSASLTTWISYMLIKVLFFFSYGIIYGFVGDEEMEILMNLWEPIYSSGHYLLYLFMAMAVSGLLPVLIVNVVLGVSVVIPNTSIIFATPIACFYLGGLLLGEIFAGQEWTDYAALFCGSQIIYGNRVLHILFTILYVSFVCVLMKWITIWAWRRRIYG